MRRFRPFARKRRLIQGIPGLVEPGRRSPRRPGHRYRDLTQFWWYARPALLAAAVAWLWLDRVEIGRRVDAVAGTSFASGAAGLYVKDGDSFEQDGDGVRLAGIDAPELDQTCTEADGRPWPCGRAAKAALVALAAAGDWECVAVARDKYGRRLATCRDGAGRDIAAITVRDGLAISAAYGDRERYAAEQADARAARRGIWRGPHVTPAQWRAGARGEPEPTILDRLVAALS